MIKLKPFRVSIQMLAIVTLVTIITIAVLTVSVSPVKAEGNQSNQDINQPALLIAPDPDFQINVYPKPSTDKRRVGYGSGGDTVTVMEQVGSNQGYIWNYVRFEKSPHLEGWIREDFVAIQETVGETSRNENRTHSVLSVQNNSWHNQRIGDRQDNQYSRQHSRQYRGEPQNSDQQTRHAYPDNQRQNNYSQRQN